MNKRSVYVKISSCFSSSFFLNQGNPYLSSCILLTRRTSCGLSQSVCPLRFLPVGRSFMHIFASLFIHSIKVFFSFYLSLFRPLYYVFYVAFLSYGCISLFTVIVFNTFISVVLIFCFSHLAYIFVPRAYVRVGLTYFFVKVTVACRFKS